MIGQQASSVAMPAPEAELEIVPVAAEPEATAS